MPYRQMDGGRDSPVELLLVTSRETKRWVLPKGNRMKGMTSHAAAAQEALEEAGVLGAACPAPLGCYRYRKRLESGAALLVDVEVFPLAVTEELADWPERAQRTRRWFPLAEASEAVEEADLGALIRGFGASEFNRVSGEKAPFDVVKSVKQGLHGFRWFRALLPRQGQVFALFEAHGQTLVSAGSALARLLQAGPSMDQHIREIDERDDEAGTIAREMLRTVRASVFTPFGHGATTSLISAMDGAIGAMQQTARGIKLYEVTEFTQEMRDIAAIIVDSARLLADALPLLRDINANAARLHELTARLLRLAGRADDIHGTGLKKSFKAHGASNVMAYLIARELYSHLKRAADRFEDVANEIDNLVIGHR